MMEKKEVHRRLDDHIYFFHQILFPQYIFPRKKVTVFVLQEVPTVSGSKDAVKFLPLDFLP